MFGDIIDSANDTVTKTVNNGTVGYNQLSEESDLQGVTSVLPGDCDLF